MPDYVPLPLRVLTRNMQTGEITERVIDHNNHHDRVWLGKHCFWAFRNGRGVQTEPCNG
jgi:hypothetical protein